MPGPAEERGRGSHLHELPDVHHGHPVADVPDHAQVVGHEEVGEVEALLELEEQVEHLGLHGDVERGDGLVGDHEPRLRRQRPGDADALPLAAAEGVGEAVHVLGPHSDQAQQLGHAVPARAAVPETVDQERLPDVVEQRHPRIERPERILEDHLDLGPERAQLLPGQLGQVHDGPLARPEEDLPARRRHGPEDAAGGRRLAAAALADEPEGLALADLEAHVVDGADLGHHPPREALPDGKELPQVLDLEQRVRRRGPGLAPPGVTTSPPRRGRGSSSPAAGHRRGGGRARAGRRRPASRRSIAGGRGSPGAG